MAIFQFVDVPGARVQRGWASLGWGWIPGGWNAVFEPACSLPGPVSEQPLLEFPELCTITQTLLAPHPGLNVELALQFCFRWQARQ